MRQRAISGRRDISPEQRKDSGNLISVAGHRRKRGSLCIYASGDQRRSQFPQFAHGTREPFGDLWREVAEDESKQSAAVSLEY